jgi:hypothetical protein
LFYLVVQGQTILYDSFSEPSNPNGWPLVSNSTEEKSITGGKYLLDHKPSEGFLTATVTREINTSRDFEMGTSMEFRSGDTKDGHGLIYGYSSDENYQRFSISSTGWYSIGSKENGTYIVIKDWTRSSLIKQGADIMNDLKIVKTGSEMHYYINGTKVFSSIFKEFKGDQVGFIVYYDHAAAADYIEIKYINGNADDERSKLMIEDFTSNFRNWYTGENEVANIYFENGKYHIDYSVEDKAASVDYGLRIGQDRDFEIRTLIQKVDGSDSSPYGIEWGRLDDANHFNFVILDQGKFGIYKVENGEVSLLTDVEATSLVNKSRESIVRAYNELMIRKIGNRYTFYINNTEVKNLPFKPFFGDRIGISFENDIHIAVDYLYVFYLD